MATQPIPETGGTRSNDWLRGAALGWDASKEATVKWLLGLEEIPEPINPYGELLKREDTGE